MNLEEQYNPEEYDVRAMQIDLETGNFSPENAEEYRHENIVRASLLNGQFKQAMLQCREYGLTYDLELYKFRQDKE
jgi:hypothetical protein